VLEVLYLVIESDVCTESYLNNVRIKPHKAMLPYFSSLRFWCDQSLLQKGLVFLLVVVIAGLTGGCDAVSVHSSESPEGPRSSGDTDFFTKADLLFEPINLSEGETFSIDLIDDDFDSYVARITHREGSSGQQRVSASFNAINPSSVTLRCRSEDRIVQKQDITRRFTQLLKSTGSKVATSDDEPDSYHYIDNGETTIVEVDYDVEDSKSTTPMGTGQTSVKFNSSSKTVNCTHLGFVMKGVSKAISADRIQFSGAVEEPEFRKRVFE